MELETNAKSALLVNFWNLYTVVFVTREAREGCPLLTVETGVNGDSESTRPGLFRRACRASTRNFCPALAALVGPVQNIFFLTVHHFNSFVPIAQQSGQAAMLGCLSLSMCLCP